LYPNYSMKQSIIELVDKHDCEYIELDNENDLKLVYDCLINHHIDYTDNTSGTVLLYYGFYYRYVQINPESMKQCYLLGIDKHNVYCAHNLANWYRDQNDIENMKKYYLMAIEKKYAASIYNYAVWCEKYEDYDTMIKYHLMGAKYGDNDCIYRMNRYFKKSFDVKNMCRAYSFLTDTNKKKLNGIIVDVMKINNIDVINETVCVHCQQVTKCIFLTCSHGMCIECYGSNICCICLK
jgi:hypothetical protein